LERTFLINVSFLDPVQEGVQRVEERMLGQAEGLNPELSAALGLLISAGGKRIRVAVTLLMGRMFKANDVRLTTLASAIELLHTATLVHDDLIDGALIRRGTPTLNASWSPAATVLTGDYIFARAAKLAAETGSIQIMTQFAETLAIIVNGEITQMFGKRQLIDRAAYEKRIYAKTASLFETACRSAAILGTQDETMWENARVYGYQVGMAFQIVDDILDFTGEQETVGKPVANDLRQGLVTLPALLYYEHNPSQGLVKSVIKGEATEAEIDQLVDSIRKDGAIEASIQIANEFVENGLQALSNFPSCLERRSLESLARFIIERRK
jgi:geranylgeranyl pyrophosphate synthase